MKPKTRPYRTGAISIEQAREKFHEYYDNKHRASPIALFRAKLFDMMYTKKDKFLIKCNNTDEHDKKNDIAPGMCESGSVKYLLEEGPKTFDAEWVDSFPDGTKFNLEKTDGTIGDYIALGHTSKLSKVDGSKQVKEKGVYGPRVRSNKKLYAEYFRKQYKDRKDAKKSPGSKGFKKQKSRGEIRGTTNELVDIYWDKYYSENLERKNKKTGKKKSQEIVFNFALGVLDYHNADSLLTEDQMTDKNKKYTLVLVDGKLVINYNNMELSSSLEKDILEDFLEKLKIQNYSATDKKFMFNKKLKDTKYFKLVFISDDDDTEMTVILNIVTGKLYDEGDLTKVKFASLLDFWQEEDDFSAEDLTFKEDSSGPFKQQGGNNKYETEFKVTDYGIIGGGVHPESSDDEYSYFEDSDS